MLLILNFDFIKFCCLGHSDVHVLKVHPVDENHTLQFLFFARFTSVLAKSFQVILLQNPFLMSLISSFKSDEMKKKSMTTCTHLESL